MAHRCSPSSSAKCAEISGSLVRSSESELLWPCDKCEHYYRKHSSQKKKVLSLFMKEQINFLFFYVVLYDGSSGVLHMILAENNLKQKEECIVKPAEDEQCISDTSESLQGSELLRYHHVSYERYCEKGSEKANIFHMVRKISYSYQWMQRDNLPVPICSFFKQIKCIESAKIWTLKNLLADRREIS